MQQDPGTQYGFVFQSVDYEGGVVNALEYIWTSGGNVLENDEVVIDSPEARRGLEIERSMISDGVSPEAVSQYKEQEVGRSSSAAARSYAQRTTLLRARLQPR